MSAPKHDAGSLTSDQEAAVAGQFPGLEEQLLRGVQQRLVDVRTGIVEADLDRSDFAFDLGKQLLHLRLLTGIDAERVNFMTRSREFIHEPLGFGGVTPADANRIAAPGKTPRDGRADGVARTHEYRYAATFRHSRFSHQVLIWYFDRIGWLARCKR